jgi:hypothetical protein
MLKKCIDAVGDYLDVGIDEGNPLELEHAECFERSPSYRPQPVAVMEDAHAADRDSPELAAARGSKLVLDVLRHASSAMVSAGKHDDLALRVTYIEERVDRHNKLVVKALSLCTIDTVRHYTADVEDKKHPRLGGDCPLLAAITKDLMA